MTNEELLLYYTNLLIIQYHDKPNARGFMAAGLNALMTYELLIDIKNGYNIDDAKGAQLDILGKYLGSDRIVTGVAFTRDYFGLSLYGETTPFNFYPYSAYSDIAPDAQYRRYAESAESLFSLNDEEYRQILKLKIGQNNGNASNKDIDNLLEGFFENQAIFTDRENMSISYIFQGNQERLVTIALSEGLIPKPAAVGISVSFVPDIENIFVYDKYGEPTPDFGVGFAKYGETAVGGWLGYE